MKKLKLSLLTFIAFQLNAQQVNYKVTLDEPKNITNMSCNIDLAHMDLGFGNIEGLNLSCGVFGHVMYKNRLGVDYAFRYGWLTGGKAFGNKDLKNGLNIQLGGFLVFSQTQKVTSAKVILKSQSAGTTSDGRAITKVTSIMVPSNKFKYRALRGGLYFKRNTFSDQNYYIMGAYGGLCFGSSSRLKISTDKYGEKGRTHHLRVCLDALITPINNAPTLEKYSLPIGGRLLIQTLPSIVRKESKRMYSARIPTEIELGYRMVDGWYIACGVAIPITRNIKALGYEVSEKNKRTSE